MLSSIKDKYKQIITEMNEIYDKTEGEIKNTYKGMTCMINSIGKSIKEVVGYIQGSQSNREGEQEEKERVIDLIQKGEGILGCYSCFQDMIVNSRVDVTLLRKRYIQERNLKRLDKIVCKINKF